MSSNLRAKPIEGYITDSAGNILRNAVIVIKQETPLGSKTIESTKSDDAGYFSSNPVPNGTYSIYESGIVVSRVIHRPDHNSIQAFKSDELNYKPTTVGTFTDLAADAKLNTYRIFLQIESTNIDVARFGSSFPIYEFDIGQSPNIAESGQELFHMSQFLELDPVSRITTTRFDIEYYSPITSASSAYKRIRWAGVPGIRFSKDSQLVVPLDYFSIVTNFPKLIDPVSDTDTYTDLAVNMTGTTAGADITGSEMEAFSQSINNGDIIKVMTKEDTNPSTPELPWYGIVTSVSGDPIISLEEWKSSRFTSTVNPADAPFVTRMMAFDGMFNGINDIDESVNERFTVVENISAQNNEQELYNYNNRIIT